MQSENIKILNHEKITGLKYLENFITKDEEQSLISEINKGAWNTDLARRTQHFGYNYGYKSHKLEKVTPIPQWNNFIFQRLISLGVFPESETPTQLIINEYEPGQGITAHIDDTKIFGHRVISLSLGSGCIMQFSKSNMEVDVYLKPCSLVILEGESRYKWTHSIPKRKSDINPETSKKIVRTTRVSLTYRVAVVDVLKPVVSKPDFNVSDDSE